MELRNSLVMSRLELCDEVLMAGLKYNSIHHDKQIYAKFMLLTM